ncbi:universal stress protein [Weizmannia acidilactici]|nr:universal stress protein [Weizmannia acidilactici]
MYKHIVIAYDDSDGCRKALERAAEFVLAVMGLN